jgi:hypothetical protein
MHGRKNLLCTTKAPISCEETDENEKYFLLDAAVPLLGRKAASGGIARMLNEPYLNPPHTIRLL